VLQGATLADLRVVASTTVGCPWRARRLFAHRVDPRLRVRGIEGLCVADASIIPAALNACTHAPTIMIGTRPPRWDMNLGIAAVFRDFLGMPLARTFGLY
jgi:GMC oxidoreductase